MISGIFTAAFRSNQGKMGTGVAIISGGFVHGGDDAFYYRGKYKLEDVNKFSGKIEVVKYSEQSVSVLGPLTHYNLILNGIVNDTGFELSGQVEGKPNLMITITLKKVDDLIEA